MSLFETYLESGKSPKALDNEIIKVLQTGVFTIYFTGRKFATIIDKKVSDETANFLANDPEGLDEEDLKKFNKLKIGKKIFNLNLNYDELGYADALHVLMTKALKGKIGTI
jgi:hypothetical protein